MSIHPSRTGAARELETYTTLALYLLTIATAILINLVVDGFVWFLPLVTCCGIVHGLCYLGRKWKFNSGLVLLGCTFFVIEFLATSCYGSTMSWVLPSGVTINAARTDLNTAMQNLQQYEAPVSYTQGILLILTPLFAVMIFVSDWMAFRKRFLIESVLFQFGLFCFASILGSAQHSVLIPGFFVICLLIFSAFQLASLRAISVSPRSAEKAKQSYAKSGIALGLIGVALALIFTPLIPGYNSNALITLNTDGFEDSSEEPRGSNGGGNPGNNQTNIDPSVAIKPSVIKNSTREVFTVKAPERSYWRQQTLNFDGSKWTPMPVTNSPVDIDGQTKPYRFKVNGPTKFGFTPSQVVSVNSALPHLYDSGTAQLQFSNAIGAGSEYDLRAPAQQITAEQLKINGTNSYSNDPNLIQYLSAIPLSSVLQAKLAEIIGDKTNEYDKALALQNYFRDNYRYEIPASDNTDVSDVDDFVLAAKSGYCQQFAIAFSTLARASGIPTRISVGYTTGVKKADGLFHVQGIHAHAWPEIYFKNVGWVAFEPTPGRGNPLASQYTGIKEQQVNQNNVQTATTLPSKTKPTSTTISRKPSTTTLAKQPQSRPNVSVFPIAVVLLLTGAGATLVTYRRRRTHTLNPDWHDVEQLCSLVAPRRGPGQTPIHYSEMIRPYMRPATATEAERLAKACTEREFSPRAGALVSTEVLRRKVYEQVGKPRSFIHQATGLVISRKIRPLTDDAGGIGGAVDRLRRRRQKDSHGELHSSDR